MDSIFQALVPGKIIRSFNHLNGENYMNEIFPDTSARKRESRIVWKSAILVVPSFPRKRKSRIIWNKCDKSNIIFMNDNYGKT